MGYTFRKGYFGCGSYLSGCAKDCKSAWIDTMGSQRKYERTLLEIISNPAEPTVAGFASGWVLGSQGWSGHQQTLVGQ